jgi:hypothetical protein
VARHVDCSDRGPGIVHLFLRGVLQSGAELRMLIGYARVSTQEPPRDEFDSNPCYPSAARWEPVRSTTRPCERPRHHSRPRLARATPDIERRKAPMDWTMPCYTITDSFDKNIAVDEWHGHMSTSATETRCSVHTSSTAAATRRWGPSGATPISRRSAVRRLGRTRQRVTPRAASDSPQSTGSLYGHGIRQHRCRLHVRLH